MRKIHTRIATVVVFAMGILMAIPHFNDGAGTVKAAALKICGVDVPPFIVVPAMSVTRDNLAQAWAEAWHQTPPEAVTKALSQ